MPAGSDFEGVLTGGASKSEEPVVAWSTMPRDMDDLRAIATPIIPTNKTTNSGTSQKADCCKRMRHGDGSGSTGACLNWRSGLLGREAVSDDESEACASAPCPGEGAGAVSDSEESCSP